MRLVDKLLGKIGLARKSEQERLVSEWEAFSLELSKHAKGVNIVNGGVLLDQHLEGDVFVFGDSNTVAHCRVFGGCVKESPSSNHNWVAYNTYIYEKEE